MEESAKEPAENQKPRDESDRFDNENEFEGVSDSGEGEDTEVRNGSNLGYVCEVS